MAQSRANLDQRHPPCKPARPGGAVGILKKGLQEHWLRCRSVAEIRANLDRMQIPYEPAAIEALVAAAGKKRRLRAEPEGPVEFYNDKVWERLHAHQCARTSNWMSREDT